ncbi:hypothetical protein SUGI_0740280 [Cryptomeria japonica]|nr:hypothetical protein SUGI_0740280 [Cryptomeria japonica]
MAHSALVPAIQALSDINCPQGKILTKQFLQLCATILPVLDKLGPTMAVIRSDIGGNIQRLDDMYESSKSEYAFLYEIVRKEAAQGTAKKPLSCTKAVLWLTRGMEFMIVLLGTLVEQEEWSLKQAVEYAYNTTLKQWHGWISTAASNVGLKLIPERQNFMKLLGDTTNFKEDVDKLSASLSPLLQANHAFLQSLRLNRMKSS